MNDGISEKLFVVLFHRAHECIVAKATSKVGMYLQQDRADWVVWFRPKEVSYFSKLTAIQPDNVFGISHADIQRSLAKGDFKVLGSLPAKFKGQFLQAINASDLISLRMKKALLQSIG